MNRLESSIRLMFLTQIRNDPRSEGLRNSTGKAVVRHASKGNRKRRSSEKVISTDKAGLLWMYCKEIAPFETPTFSKKVGELIARATSAPQKRATYQQQMRTLTIRQL